MRRVNFDYENTCPSIDREIRNAKGAIENFLQDFICDLSPMIPEKTRKEIAENRCNDLFSELEDFFERTRGTNEDMREAAEKQIADLIDELDSAKCDIDSLKKMLEDQS